MKMHLRSLSLTVLSSVAFTYMGCKKDSDKAPEFMEITSFTPAEGSAGDTITIHGKKFSPDNASNIVQLNGVPMELYKASETELKFILSPAASTGNIKVKAGADSAISTSNFVVTPAVATLTSFSPDHGERGTVVTLTGRKMLPDAEIFYDGQKITSFEPGRTLSSVSFKIPGNAKAGKIEIKQNGIIKQSSRKFIVTNIWEKISKNTVWYNINNGVAYTYNGNLYYGMGSDGTNDNSWFWKYDTSAHTWSQSSRGGGSGEYATLLEHNGKIYVGDGILKNGTEQSKWWEFDPASPEQWSSNGEWKFPANLNGGISFVHNGNIYAGLGTSYSTLYQWDRPGSYIFDWKWKNGMYYTPLCLYYASHFVIGGQVYICSGISGCGSGSGNSKCWKLNPDIPSIAEIAPLPEETQRTQAFSYNGKGYVISHSGGFYEYDPASNTWTTRTNTGIASRYASVIDGRMFSWAANGEMVEFIHNY